MKITKYFLSMAAAVGMIAGCQKPEMIQIAAPEDVKAPVLEAIAGPIEITPTNMALEKVTFSWSAADYGVPTQVNYSLAAARAAAPETVVTITSGLTTTTAEVTYDVLNQILFNDLKLADGVAEDVTFKIGAKLGEYEKIYSNVITVSCKVTAAEKVYPMIYMPGSYQGWDPAGTATKFQVLYDFAGNGVFEGIADFGTSPDASRAWKFTPKPNWDFDWGVPKGQTPDAEAAEITLINNDGGDRSDIAAYTEKRFYHFSMDTNTGLLKHNYSFDQVGVVGEITGWADGADKVMEFNAAKRRFYVDIEGLKGQFKFRLDGAWTKNWGAGDFGVEVSNKDGNLETSEGNFRVYLYLSNPAELSYELVAGMYGKEEPVDGPTAPAPDQPGNPDVSGEKVTMYFMPDASWIGDDITFAAWIWADGGDGSWYEVTDLDSDGVYEVTFPKELQNIIFASMNGATHWDNKINQTADLKVPTDGKNAYDGATGTWVEFGNPNVTLYFKPNSSWTGDNITFAAWIWATGANGSWFAMDDSDADGIYAVTFPKELDNIIFASMNGATDWNNKVNQTADLKVPTDGKNTYAADTWMTLEEAKGAEEPVGPAAPVVVENAVSSDVTMLEEDSIYGIIGVNGWEATDDIMMKKTSDANVFVAKDVQVSSTFKIRKAGGWDDTANFGLESYTDLLDVNKGYEVITSGGSKDLKVPAGTYDIWFHLEKMHIYIMEAGKHASEAN